MPQSRLPKGSTARVRAAFIDPDTKLAVDPGTVSVTYRTPMGLVVTKTYQTDAEVTRTSLGNFLLRLPLALEGTYRGYWTGTAVNETAVLPWKVDSYSEADF